MFVCVCVNLHCVCLCNGYTPLRAVFVPGECIVLLHRSAHSNHIPHGYYDVHRLYINTALVCSETNTYAHTFKRAKWMHMDVLAIQDSLFQSLLLSENHRKGCTCTAVWEMQPIRPQRWAQCCTVGPLESFSLSYISNRFTCSWIYIVQTPVV